MLSFTTPMAQRDASPLVVAPWSLSTKWSIGEPLRFPAFKWSYISCIATLMSFVIVIFIWYSHKNEVQVYTQVLQFELLDNKELCLPPRIYIANWQQKTYYSCKFSESGWLTRFDPLLCFNMLHNFFILTQQYIYLHCSAIWDIAQ